MSDYLDTLLKMIDVDVSKSELSHYYKGLCYDVYNTHFSSKKKPGIKKPKASTETIGDYYINAVSNYFESNMFRDTQIAVVDDGLAVNITLDFNVNDKSIDVDWIDEDSVDDADKIKVDDLGTKLFKKRSIENYNRFKNDKFDIIMSNNRENWRFIATNNSICKLANKFYTDLGASEVKFLMCELGPMPLMGNKYVVGPIPGDKKVQIRGLKENSLLEQVSFKITDKNYKNIDAMYNLSNIDFVYNKDDTLSIEEACSLYAKLYTIKKILKDSLTNESRFMLLYLLYRVGTILNVTGDYSLKDYIVDVGVDTDNQDMEHKFNLDLLLQNGGKNITKLIYDALDKKIDE